MDPKSRITIIGTGAVGTSIGMALRQSHDAEHLEIVGHDCELRHAREAQQLGGFDRVELNLDLALNTARLVIVAVPLAALRDVTRDLGRLLEPGLGAVITSIAQLTAPALAWANELIPKGNYFVAGHVTLAPDTAGWEPLSGAAAARADLLQKATYAIAMQPDSHPSAIRTVSNLATVLKAQPLLVDPLEHDAASVLAAALPDIVAASLFQTVAEDSGWTETRRIAGREFATATAAASGDTESRRMAALLQRATLLRGLDQFRDRVDALYAAIERGDAEMLDATLARTAHARENWMKGSLGRSWEVDAAALQKDGLFRRTLQALVGEGLAKQQRPQS